MGDSMVGGRRAVVRLAFVSAAASAAAVFPAQAGMAAAGDIHTVAGGVGSGPALNLGQDVRAVFASPARVWLLDQAPGATQFRLRVINTSTHQESAPLATVTASGSGYIPVLPSIAADRAGDVFIAYNSPTSGGVVEEVTP